MIRNRSNPIWQTLAFSGEYLEGCVRNLNTIAADGYWSALPPAEVERVEEWARRINTWGGVALAMIAMGYSEMPPHFSNFQIIGERIVSASLYYFFGSWRDSFTRFRRQYDRKQARTELAWSNLYRKGIAVSAGLSEWDDVDQLLKWPGPDLPPDPGTDERDRADNAYQIWLASRLRGEPEETAIQQRELIERRNRRRPKMLLKSAQAMLDGDGPAFSSALEAYLRLYRNREIKPNLVQNGICIDAMFLWYLARRRNIKELKLSDDVRILIPGYE